MPDYKKVQKLLDLAKQNPEKLDELLEKMQEPEQSKISRSKKIEISQKAKQMMVRTLGTGIIKFLNMNDDKPRKGKRWGG